ALHRPLLDDVLPDEIANAVPRDRVEDVVLHLRVRGDPDAVDPDAEDRCREAPLVIEPHSVTIRFSTRRPFSSQAFSIISRFRVPTACPIRTACFAASRPSSWCSLCTRTSWKPLGWSPRTARGPRYPIDGRFQRYPKWRRTFDCPTWRLRLLLRFLFGLLFRFRRRGFCFLGCGFLGLLLLDERAKTLSEVVDRPFLTEAVAFGPSGEFGLLRGAYLGRCRERLLRLGHL